MFNGSSEASSLLPSNQSKKAYLGICLAFFSGLIMTIYSAILKIIVMDTLQVVVIRGLLQFTIMAAINLTKRFPLGNIQLLQVVVG